MTDPAVRGPEHDDTTPEALTISPSGEVRLDGVWVASIIRPGCAADETLLDIIDRVRAALAATPVCPYVETGDEGTSHCRLAEGRAAVPDTPGENPYSVPAGPADGASIYGRNLHNAWDEGYAAGLAAGRAATGDDYDELIQRLRDQRDHLGCRPAVCGEAAAVIARLAGRATADTDPARAQADR